MQTETLPRFNEHNADMGMAALECAAKMGFRFEMDLEAGPLLKHETEPEYTVVMIGKDKVKVYGFSEEEKTKSVTKILLEWMDPKDKLVLSCLKVVADRYPQIADELCSLVADTAEKEAKHE